MSAEVSSTAPPSLAPGAATPPAAPALVNNVVNMTIGTSSTPIGAVERRKSECNALPKGWQREEVPRRTGLSAGKVDVYYYSPSGKKFRSKPQLARYLGDSLDLACFDFQQGRLNSLLLRKSRKPRGTQFDYSRGVRSDASLVPPIRQTASIFKQPVTVYKTQESKVKTDFKQGSQDKPKQLFWEKRLEGLSACDSWGVLGGASLPRGIKSIGPYISEATTIQALATALHVTPQPVTGQTGSKTAIAQNPGVFLNPEQPLVQAVSVAEEDIRRQEERVNRARRKLQEALGAVA